MRFKQTIAAYLIKLDLTLYKCDLLGRAQRTLPIFMAFLYDSEPLVQQ